MRPEEHSDPVIAEEAAFSEEELRNRPTTMPPIQVEMRGFEEVDANTVGSIIFLALKTLGKILNLERLEAVTVAHDYVEALAAVNHGFAGQHVPTPTRDKYGRGIAMTVTVLRNGEPRSHMVLDASHMTPIVEAETEAGKIAFHILAHESVHVHDLRMQDRAYPGVFATMIPDTRDRYFFRYVQPCWEEYIAQKISACFASDMETEGYETAFCQIFEGVRNRGNLHIKQYVADDDITKLMEGLHREYGDMLKYLAYLVGHIAGLNQSFSEAAPKANKLIEESRFFAQLFPRFVACLDAMHETYGNWTGREVFEPLKTVVEDLLKTTGIKFSPLPDGQWFMGVNVLQAFLP